jgi:hypothetical protein
MTKQYYHKNEACRAASAFDADCICWHDFGTGPVAPADQPQLTVRTRRDTVNSEGTVAIDREVLMHLLIYDAETGVFTWRFPMKNGQVKAGAVAGHVNAQGYLTTNIRGVGYRLHRLAWLFEHGAWPKGVIDHLNRVRTDNRIANLRDVSHRVNAQNVMAPNVNGTSGVRGVSWNKLNRNWGVRISTKEGYKHIGCFASVDEAKAAYLAAKKIHHEGFNHAGG